MLVATEVMEVLMKITIAPKAMEHFQKNNITAISVLFPGCGKWNSPTRQASVGLVEPKDLTRYECRDVDGIKVCVRDDVRKYKDEITVSMSKKFWSVHIFAD